MGGDKEDGAYAHEATFINAPVEIAVTMDVGVILPPVSRDRSERKAEPVFAPPSVGRPS